MVSDTKQKILEAATEVFAAIGFAGARVDEIAERAGVNKAMLYYHVGDKERLYATVLTSTIDKAYEAIVGAAASSTDPAIRMQRVLDAFAQFGTSNAQFIPIMLREVASGGATLPDEMLQRMAKVFRVVADVLADGMKQGAFRKTNPLLTHVSIIGSMMFLVASQPIRARLARVAGVDSEHTFAELAEHTGELFMRGIESSSRQVAEDKSSSRRVVKSSRDKSSSRRVVKSSRDKSSSRRVVKSSRKPAPRVAGAAKSGRKATRSPK